MSGADTRKTPNLPEESLQSPLNLTTPVTSNGHTTVLIKRVCQPTVMRYDRGHVKETALRKDGVVAAEQGEQNKELTISQKTQTALNRNAGT